jgi:hypothetical protein
MSNIMIKPPETEVGTSFSGCVRSLVNGERQLANVEVIYTDSPPESFIDDQAFTSMLAVAIRFWCANDNWYFKHKFRSIATKLYKEKKIVPYAIICPADTRPGDRKAVALEKLGLQQYVLWQKSPNRK